MIETTRHHGPIDENPEMRRKSIASPFRPEHRKIDRWPNEFRIEMKIKAILQVNALFYADVLEIRRGRAESRDHAGEHFLIPRIGSPRITQVPKAVIQIDIGTIIVG